MVDELRIYRGLHNQLEASTTISQSPRYRSYLIREGEGRNWRNYSNFTTVLLPTSAGGSHPGGWVHRRVLVVAMTPGMTHSDVHVYLYI